MRRGVVRLVASLIFALPAYAQDAPKPHARLPFGVGERLEYQVKFGKLSVGSARWKCWRWTRCADTTSGTRCSISKEAFRSIASTTSTSRGSTQRRSPRSAILQDIDEGSYEPKRHFEIFPERHEYIETNKEGKASDPQESVDHPARRRVVHLFPAHAPAPARDGHELQRLLQGESKSRPSQSLGRKSTRSIRRSAALRRS